MYDDPKELKIMRPYPPLGILYLSAYLKEHQLENEIFDTTFSTKEKLKEHLQNTNPDIIAIYTNLMTKVNVVEIMNFIRTQEHLKESKIVLGGPDLRYNIPKYLDAGADFLVIGEGEKTMLELAKTIETVDVPDFNHITGIAFRDKDGGIVKTAEREKIRNVDELPFPNRLGIDLHAYLNVWKDNHGKSTVNISTQRGCPYTCKWCSTAVYGQSYRRRSPEKVVDEMLHLKEHFNPDALWFVDDVFTVSHKWLASFVEEVNKRDAIIPFECITRADRMKEEVIQLLQEAGCFRVWIGAESGSQKIIDLMDRRVNVDHVRDMIKMTREYGIEAGTFIMLGYPGETEEDIELTIEHLKASNPDQFTITIAYPIKGTGLYEHIDDIRTTTPDWNTSTDRQIDFKRTYPREYYDYAVKRVVNEVNYHKETLKNQSLSVDALKFKMKYEAAKMGMWWIKRNSEQTITIPETNG